MQRHLFNYIFGSSLYSFGYTGPLRGPRWKWVTPTDLGVKGQNLDKGHSLVTWPPPSPPSWSCWWRCNLHPCVFHPPIYSHSRFSQGDLGAAAYRPTRLLTSSESSHHGDPRCRVGARGLARFCRGTGTWEGRAFQDDFHIPHRQTGEVASCVCVCVCVHIGMRTAVCVCVCVFPSSPFILSFLLSFSFHCVPSSSLLPLLFSSSLYFTSLLFFPPFLCFSPFTSSATQRHSCATQLTRFRLEGNVCDYIYIHIYIYTCVYIWIYRCVYICMYIYIYVYRCVYIYIWRDIYVCVCIYIYGYMCVYIYMCIYIYVYIYTGLSQKIRILW